MPLEYTYDPKMNMVTTRFWGTVTAAELEQRIVAVLGDSRIKPGALELVDLSDVESTDVDSGVLQHIIGIGRKLGSQVKVIRRAAVAPDDLTYGMARMFEMMSEAAGLSAPTQTFRTKEAALKWLSEPGSEA